MTRVIIFSDYLKAADKTHMKDSLSYIATRDGVELNEIEKAEFSTPLNEKTAQYAVSSKQNQLLHNLLEKHSDLKELFEYDAYQKNSNMYTASLFISSAMNRLEEMSLSNERYLKYISERPGVDKQDSLHGLFDRAGAANLAKYQQQLENHNGNVYRNIISLTRQDAHDLGYEDQESWKKLLTLHMPSLAESLKIPSYRFEWVAAFHNESYHPHVHVMFWDKNAGHVFQTEEHINKFKSSITNDIFKNEMWIAKEYKSEMRDKLESKFRNLVQDYNTKYNKKLSPFICQRLENQLKKLIELLPENGSKNYAYQPQEVKQATKNILSSLLETKELKPLFDEYVKSQVNIAAFYQKNQLDIYADKVASTILDPKKNDRKVMQNIILSTAYQLRDQLLQEKFLNLPSLSSLNQKIDEGMVDQKFISDHKQVIQLTDAVIKLDVLQDKSIVEHIPSIKKFNSNETEILERAIAIKENQNGLTKKEMRLLSMAYQEKNIAQNLNLYQQKKDSIITNSITHIFRSIVNFMSSRTVENEQAANRIKAIHREDEFLIKQAKHKQERK